MGISPIHSTIFSKGGLFVPAWLQNQIQKAFYEKNSRQVQLLNQCWFFYKKSIALDE